MSMRKHSPALFWAALLLALHLPVLFAGFFAPYDYTRQDRELPFAPPSHLHFVDQAGSFHARPFVYAWKQSEDGNSYEEDSSRPYKVRFLVSGAPYGVLPGWTGRLHLFGIEEPQRLFLFGTDGLGRDLFSRMLFGGRVSLLAGFLGAAVALLAGGALGIAAGFYGSWLDAALMRLVELFLALPWLYLLFALRAVLPLHIKTTDAFLLFIAVVGLVGWARPARLVRGIVLSARERNFVLAARAMGASNLHILRWHILPQIYRVSLTMAALLVPQFILAEITLSFLGLGVGEPTPTWGNLLTELQKYNVLVSYWWMYLPAVMLVALFSSYYWISDSLEKTFVMVDT